MDRMESMLNKRMDGMQNDMNQKFDNIQYSISRLTNLNTLQEKGRFPSHLPKSKGVHEVESHEGESSQVKDVKALITLRSGKKIEHPTPKPHVEKEEEMKKGKEMEDKGKMLKKSTSPPFPQALHGKKGVRNAAEILEVLRQVKVNIPLLDMIKQVPTHDWRKGSGESLARLGSKCEFASYSVYKQLGLGELKPTAITLSLADRSVKIPRGVIEDVLVQVDNFYYPVDFVVLDTDPTVKEANLVPIILGRPFLATSNAIINCRNGLMQLTFGNMTLDLNIFYMSKSKSLQEEEEGPEELCIIDTLVEEHCNQHMQDKLSESLVDIEEEEEAAVEKEIPKLNLKPLPVELKYTYLEENNQCPVVISSSQTKSQVKDASFNGIQAKLNQEGQKVLMYDTRLHIFPGKLNFRVNGYRLKPFMESFKSEKEQSTSLNLKKPKGNGFAGRGLPTVQNFLVKETSAKLAFCCQPIPQHCRSLCECVSQLRKWIWHTSATSQNSGINFAAGETRCEMKKRDFAPKHSDINFAAAKLTAKLLRNGKLLRNCRFVAELKLTPGLPFFLFIPVKNAAKRVSKSESHFRSPFIFFAKPRRPFLRSSSPLSNAGQRSISLKWHEREEQNLHLLRTAKESAKGAKSRLCSRTCSPAFAVETTTFSSEAGAPKPPARRYLTRSGGQPLKKKPGLRALNQLI
ncbi:hypothetical protein CK203_079242 [Vitis vinifera]|uniref:Uncharacterized protein n=1 Tax=Vitis vinifera TaxID=29760 RepID=A0A438FBG1_VITVI|nr:hypothetical protein CK203_079242 [Vitis vinifera]